MSQAGHLALVTGGTGFVAGELVKQLLEKGYQVRTTVRPGTDASRLQPLKLLAQALPGSLEIVEADLLAEQAFHQAVAGAEVVFHVASPFFIEADDPQAALVEPALRGTASLFAAVAAQGKGAVRRVVLTSSCAAVKGMHPAPPKDGRRYTEADWNTTSTVEGGQAYWVGKTKAEELAWEQAKQHGIDLVTILPEFILGPVLSPHARGTSEHFPHLPIKDGEDGEPPEFGVDASAAAELLSVHSVPVEETLVDMARTLLAFGL
ncbi:hypothetical protein APUTEX25_005404 [Auxenochlorella protothecoides]|uniref:Flavanone 4-reductase n=1 Tax=Auxenochlorella protothecoides TaxID=3075 RepID=A0A3M7L0Z7_AUXPR|nr:hypothetical protein APUTEX25_005404 [Auxenochlorella protothecoides]|eukprot:RMZ55126.1 hypothetical protein APUTEX25_005404 [Auxenochlorella protothecoides]